MIFLKPACETHFFCIIDICGPRVFNTRSDREPGPNRRLWNPDPINFLVPSPTSLNSDTILFFQIHFLLRNEISALNHPFWNKILWKILLFPFSEEEKLSMAYHTHSGNSQKAEGNFFGQSIRPIFCLVNLTDYEQSTIIWKAFICAIKNTLHFLKTLYKCLGKSWLLTFFRVPQKYCTKHWNVGYSFTKRSIPLNVM